MNISSVERVVRDMKHRERSTVVDKDENRYFSSSRFDVVRPNGIARSHAVLASSI